MDWPWFAHLVSNPSRSGSTACDIIDSIGFDDEHVLSFRAFEDLDTLEYLGFTEVLTELDARSESNAALKAIVSQFLDFCVPLMQGISNRPSTLDLKIKDGPYAILSPSSVTEMLRRFDSLPKADFRPLYESSPALKAWTEQWNAEAPEVTFEDFEIHCETWAELLDLAARRSWGIFCLI